MAEAHERIYDYRQGISRGANYFRMIGQPQIIVRAKIDDRARTAFVVNNGARIGGGEHLGFVN